MVPGAFFRLFQFQLFQCLIILLQQNNEAFAQQKYFCLFIVTSFHVFFFRHKFFWRMTIKQLCMLPILSLCSAKYN